MKNKTCYLCLASALIWAVLSATAIPIYAQEADNSSTETLSPEFEKTSDSNGLRFNFRGVSLDTVLDYMSKSAGFIIVRNTEVSGRLDVISHQPLTKDEAVALLNTVLNEKGYAAIRNGRVLTIVDRDEAGKHDIPVRTGRDPERIPKNDEMVTQIIPVRYTNAVKLIDNIKPLLPSYAIISANESSNAIVLTDTQSSIRRIAEIIQALDTSISEISSLKVFMLKYADATETAKMINEIFKVPESGQTTADRRAQFFARRFTGRSDESSRSSEGEKSEARQAASRVLAIADEHTNSIVVSAPEEVMPTVERLVKEIDISSQQLTEVRVFTLRYADAEETAELITEVFEQEDTSGQTSVRRRFRGPMMPPASDQGQQSQRKKEESRVVAKADTRTNSVVVSAVSEVMQQIEMMIERLDENPAKDQKVFIYSLKNADAEKASSLLQEMFSEQTNRSSGSSAGTSTRSSGSTTTSRRSTQTTR